MSFFLFYSTRRWFILSNIIFLVLNSLLTHDPNSYGSSSSSIFFFFLEEVFSFSFLLFLILICFQFHSHFHSSGWLFVCEEFED